MVTPISEIGTELPLRLHKISLLDCYPKVMAGPVLTPNGPQCH